MNGKVSSALKPKGILRILLIQYAVMATGIFIFMMVAVFFARSKEITQLPLAEYQDQVSWIFGTVSLLCLIVARLVFSKGIKAAKTSLNSLTDKLSSYRKSLFRYLAICEIPVSINIIAFFLTGNFNFLVFASVLLGFMLGAVPLKRRVVSALELDWQQQQELE